MHASPRVYVTAYALQPGNTTCVVPHTPASTAKACTHTSLITHHTSHITHYTTHLSNVTPHITHCPCTPCRHLSSEVGRTPRGHQHVQHNHQAHTEHHRTRCCSHRGLDSPRGRGLAATAKVYTCITCPQTNPSAAARDPCSTTATAAAAEAGHRADHCQHSCTSSPQAKSGPHCYMATAGPGRCGQGIAQCPHEATAASHTPAATPCAEGTSGGARRSAA
jgi:hypothetical protein